MYSTEKAYNIGFGMMGYGYLWRNCTENSTPEEFTNALLDMARTIWRNNKEFCVVSTPEYETAVAVYDIKEKCYRVAGYMTKIDKTNKICVMWKKYRFINNNKNWQTSKTCKSVSNMYAEFIGIADKEAINLIGEKNKVLNIQVIKVNE